MHASVLCYSQFIRQKLRVRHIHIYMTSIAKYHRIAHHHTFLIHGANRLQPILEHILRNLSAPHRIMVKAHYGDVIMGAIASQITSLTIVYSTAYSDAVHRKHQSSASLAFARGLHRGPVNSPHKWPVTRKKFPFDDVIMRCLSIHRSVVWDTLRSYLFICVKTHCDRSNTISHNQR